MRLIMTLLASSILLIGCASKEDPKQDLSALRAQCMEQSGFTGNANYFPGGVFIWRADGEEVAECSIHNGHVHLIGILGHSHPGDS